MDWIKGITSENVKIVISIVTAFAFLPKGFDVINVLINKFKYLPDHKELDKIEERLQNAKLSQEALNYLKERQDRIVFRMCYNIDAGPELRKVLHKFHHMHQGEISWAELRTAFPRIRLAKQEGKEPAITVSYRIFDSIHKLYISVIVWYIRFSAFMCFYLTMLVAFGVLDLSEFIPKAYFVYSGLISVPIMLISALVFRSMSLPSITIKKIRDLTLMDAKKHDVT